MNSTPSPWIVMSSFIRAQRFVGKDQGNALGTVVAMDPALKGRTTGEAASTPLQG
jgi:hypothetical protein